MNRRDRRFLLREIGVAARRARRAGGWSQARVAALAGTSQATVSRIEAAHPGVSTAALLDVLAELGLALRLADDPAYVAERTAQRDPAHARCAAYVGRHLERLGWMVAHEVEVGRDRFRGWIDLLAFHPSTGTVLLIEIKTVLVMSERSSASWDGTSARRGPRHGAGDGRRDAWPLRCSFSRRPRMTADSSRIADCSSRGHRAGSGTCQRDWPIRGEAPYRTVRS